MPVAAETPVGSSETPKTLTMPQQLVTDVVNLITTSYATVAWPEVDQALRLVALQIRANQAQSGVPPL